ncbi:MAG: hypothetical protein ACJAYM_000647 [Flavobacteriales bacterium]
MKLVSHKVYDLSIIESASGKEGACQMEMIPQKPKKDLSYEKVCCFSSIIFGRFWMQER